MAHLSLKNVTKKYDDVQVIHGIDLEIASGEFCVFVGLSGCGKSTLLRMIAGLEEITEGELSIYGKTVNRIAPKDRDVAMVFQNYALYPHLNVADNMAFGLRIRRMPKPEIEQQIKNVAEILELSDYLERRPADLSGGQRQRVAMGRAIVRHPKVFLFDEPLSNLDAKLRTQMRAEIRRLHNRLGVTSIYVTHDQVEAMTLADRIVVMNEGRIEQVGTPMELFMNPANIFVAGFLGSPPMNQMKGVITNEGVDIGDVTIAVEGKVADHIGRNVILGIRPEHTTLTKQKGATALPINLDLVEPLGSEALLHAQFGKDQLVFKAETQGSIDHLSSVKEVFVPASMVHLFDANTGEAISL